MGHVPQPRISTRIPKVTIDDEVAFYSIRLAKLGYYGGNPELIRKAPLDVVLQIISYENFANDLQTAQRELNDEGR